MSQNTVILILAALKPRNLIFFVKLMSFILPLCYILFVAYDFYFIFFLSWGKADPTVTRYGAELRRGI